MGEYMGKELPAITTPQFLFSLSCHTFVTFSIAHNYVWRGVMEEYASGNNGKTLFMSTGVLLYMGRGHL